MKIQLVSSTVGRAGPEAYLTTLLIDDALAIDAGSLGFHGTPRQQERVRHVFLTHSHQDHVASLPIFLENVYTGGDPPTIYGLPETLDCLQRDVFNDRVWPDFIRLTDEGTRLVQFYPLAPETPVAIAGLTLTPVLIHHAVPTAAFIVADAASSVVFATDTGPTNRLWQLARTTPNLKAVFVETTFPNSHQALADVSQHLTPRTLAAEIAKLDRAVPIFVMHLKARFRDQVIAEIAANANPHLKLVEPERAYHF